MVRREDAMHGNVVRGAGEKLRAILPVILRITFCLAMWTLGVMTITIAEARTPDQRVAPQTRTSDPGAEKLQISGDVAHKMGCRLRSEEISRDCQD